MGKDKEKKSLIRYQGHLIELNEFIKKIYTKKYKNTNISMI